MLAYKRRELDVSLRDLICSVGLTFTERFDIMECGIYPYGVKMQSAIGSRYSMIILTKLEMENFSATL